MTSLYYRVVQYRVEWSQTLFHPLTFDRVGLLYPCHPSVDLSSGPVLRPTGQGRTLGFGNCPLESTGPLTRRFSVSRLSGRDPRVSPDLRDILLSVSRNSVEEVGSRALIVLTKSRCMKDRSSVLQNSRTVGPEKSNVV